MAVNSTYSSILNEIQLSNLNYSIQMTPFGAYITLKKSVQKDLNGTPASPSLPLLFLFQQAHLEICQLREENLHLKATFERQQTKLDEIMHENVSLKNDVEENNNAVNALMI